MYVGLRVRWDRDSTRDGAWPVEKYWESLAVYAAKGIIQSSIRHDRRLVAVWSLSHSLSDGRSHGLKNAWDESLRLARNEALR